MASIHIIIEATSGTGKRIPGATVSIQSVPLPFGCAGWPLFFDVTARSDSRGVVDYDLGAGCGFGSISDRFLSFHIHVETPLGKVADAVWNFTLGLGGDYTTTVTVTSDEGSAAADVSDDLAVWWGKLGPLTQGAIVIGGAVLAGYVIYRIVKKKTE